MVKGTDELTMTNTATHYQILGGIAERIIQFNEVIGRPFLHCNRTRSRNENTWKLSLNAEVIQRTIECQRSDIKETKQTCKRHHENKAITGSGNKLIPPEQQVRQRRDQQFEGLDEFDYRLDAFTG